MFQVDIRSGVSGMQYSEKLKISLSMQKNSARRHTVRQTLLSLGELSNRLNLKYF